jgi:integrase
VASILRERGKYRAMIFVRGKRTSKTFRTKREAEAWGAQQEAELREHAGLEIGRHTLADALKKYRDEVSPTKGGARWEIVRLNKFLRSTVLPLETPIREVTTAQLAAWRDSMRATLAAGSIRRELGLMSSVLGVARREWKWLAVNPVSDVRKPPAPDHRDRLISRAEIKAVLFEAGYSPASRIESLSQRMAVCFLVSLRTAMRAGELVHLTWEHVHRDYCQLPKTKTSPRKVPITPKVHRLLDKLRRQGSGIVFGLTSAELDAEFRRCRDATDFSGFKFHDARHTAATWMARKVDVLTLCKICGWKNPKQALTYYNPTVSDMARMLE